MAQLRAELNLQAGYDFRTAQAMLKTRRYIYAVFMCHLALEKALKGLWVGRRGQAAPRKHSLLSLLKGTGATPPPSVGALIARLDQASVTTRYPEKLRALQKHFTAPVAKAILADGREALRWIRKQS
ncbi:MAG: HEPN domain-containing protein [Planctomycetes bacterium]|nr:HEPN domain-containing protein [Planctomycetota bacterium]